MTYLGCTTGTGYATYPDTQFAEGTLSWNTISVGNLAYKFLSSLLYIDVYNTVESLMYLIYVFICWYLVRIQYVFLLSYSTQVKIGGLGLYVQFLAS